MVSLTKAIETEFGYERHSGWNVYNSNVAQTYCIGNAPHGGYMLCIILQAALEFQRRGTSGLLDPSHQSASFISPASPGPCQVEIKVFSQTKRWTRLDSELWQYTTPGDRSTPRLLKIRCQTMFTNLPSLKAPDVPYSSSTNLTVLPHMPLDEARLCPIPVHPSEATRKPLYRAAQFRDKCTWAEDVGVMGKKDQEGRTPMQWGAWWQQLDPEDNVAENVALVPFFADQFRNAPEIMPKEKGSPQLWFPTLALTLQFVAKFPLGFIPGAKNSAPSNKTVGLYSTSTWMNEGAHDINVEVWSAPCNIGEDVEVGSDEWRTQCQFLGRSTQSALCVPFSVNSRRGKM